MNINIHPAIVAGTFALVSLGVGSLCIKNPDDSIATSKLQVISSEKQGWCTLVEKPVLIQDENLWYFTFTLRSGTKCSALLSPSKAINPTMSSLVPGDEVYVVSIPSLNQNTESTTFIINNVRKTQS